MQYLFSKMLSNAIPQIMSLYLGMRSLCMKAGEYEIAMPLYERALAIDPSNRLDTANLDKCRKGLEEGNETPIVLASDMQRRSEYSDLYYQEGKVSEAGGELTFATESYEKAISVNGKNAKAILALGGVIVRLRKKLKQLHCLKKHIATFRIMLAYPQCWDVFMRNLGNHLVGYPVARRSPRA